MLFAILLGFTFGFEAWSNSAVQSCVDQYGSLLRVDKIPGKGSYLYLKAEGSGLRDFDSIADLKFGQFNIENLYQYSEKFVIDPETGHKAVTRPATAKSREKFRMNRELLERADNDIMVWQEVDDLAAAKDFVDQELGGRYRVVVVEGIGDSPNANKSMEVALLVKKDLPFDLEIQSHKDVSYYNRRTRSQEKLQSRDLLVARFRRTGADPTSPPLFTIQGGHFRSMRPRKDDPVKSVKKRTLQYNHAIELRRAEEVAFPDTPVFMIADFNSNLRDLPGRSRSREADFLLDPERGGFTDSFDLVTRKKPQEYITHTFHLDADGAEYTQLDGILVNSRGRELGLVKEAKVIPFKDIRGKVLSPAKTAAERNLQGSDHRLVQTVIDFEKLRGGK